MIVTTYSVCKLGDISFNKACQQAFLLIEYGRAFYIKFSIENISVYCNLLPIFSSKVWYNFLRKQFIKRWTLNVNQEVKDP